MKIKNIDGIINFREHKTQKKYCELQETRNKYPVSYNWRLKVACVNYRTECLGKFKQ